MAAELVERELKYEVGDRFTVPEVRDLVAEGRVERGKQSLDSV